MIQSNILSSLSKGSCSMIVVLGLVTVKENPHLPQNEELSALSLCTLNYKKVKNSYLLDSIRVHTLESISIMKWNYFSLWYRSINLIICWFYFVINKVVKILLRFPDIYNMIIPRITKTNRVKYFSFGLSMFPVNFFFNFFGTVLW